MIKIISCQNCWKKYGWFRFIAGAVLSALAFFAQAAELTDNGIGHFEIIQFEVTGNTLLSSQEIKKILFPFTGKQRDFGDVERALETLENTYHQRGYSLVQVILPEQELNQSIVHFKVIEPHIGKITIQGNHVFDNANIRHSLPDLREGKTPNVGEISVSLKMANENPSKRTTLNLQSSDKENEINANLNILDQKTWKVSTSLDNTGTSSTGNTRLTMLYQNANVANRDHVLSMQYTTSPDNPSKVNIYGLGYHIPLYAQGDSIDLFGSYSDVDSGSVAAGLFNLQVSGRGTTWGGRYNHNLKRIGNYESTLLYGLDYKAYKNDVQLQGVQLGNDVTVHPISLGYTGSWSDTISEAGFVLTGVRNLPGSTNGSSEDFNLARSGASSTYRVLRYAAHYSQVLPSNWQMRLALTGQYTQDSLVPGEQFGAGGATSVRGFDEREISNDKGYQTTTELYTPNLCSNTHHMATQCRFLAFYDSAYVSRNNPLPGEQTEDSIGSIGFGFRLMISNSLTFQMDYGHVIEASQTRPKGSDRLHFRLELAY